MFKKSHASATAAMKKFVYDPASMLLPHERAASNANKGAKAVNPSPPVAPTHSNPVNIPSPTTETPKKSPTTQKPEARETTHRHEPYPGPQNAYSISPPTSLPPPYSEHPHPHHPSNDIRSPAAAGPSTRQALPTVERDGGEGSGSRNMAREWREGGQVDPLDDAAEGSSRNFEMEIDNVGGSLELMDLEEQPTESPALLSDWEVVETLGTGTFGRVLLVRLRPPYRSVSYHPIFPSIKFTPTDPNEPTPEETAYADVQQPHYALKVLAKTEIVRLKQVEHINSERAILERVRHPFLVELYGTYQDHLNVYMLLSYVPGGELFSHLRRAGRFTADVTRFYIASIILAIEYLHDRDIVYRDLKPENILLDRDGYIKIADFGFAKLIPDGVTWTLCGTPEYLAPEVVLSKGHSKSVDWWALGILTFEMLAGYPPFFDDHPMGIYEKILANKIAFPSHIDPYAKDLIRRLLTADRSKRLGNLRGGAADVRGHRWFTGVSWQVLERREIGAPIIPHVASLGDSQNFQRYPPPAPSELPGILGIPQGAADDPYKHLFEDFVFPPAAS